MRNAKTEKISEAIGNISDRHIEEAAEIRRNKTVIPKWAVLTAACLALALIFTAIAIPLFNRTDGKIPEPPVDETSGIYSPGEDTSASDTGDTMIAPGVYTIFSVAHTAVHLRLEITRFYDGIYEERSSFGHYILAEAKVIKNVYDEFAYDRFHELDIEANRPKAKDSIIIPIFVTPAEDSTPEEISARAQNVRNWLLSFDGIYIISYPEFYGKFQFTSTDDKDIKITTVYEPCLLLDSYSLLPVKDGRVMIDEVENFLNENNIGHLPYYEYGGMDQWVYNNIPCEQFEENTKTIARIVYEKKSEGYKEDSAVTTDDGIDY